MKLRHQGLTNETTTTARLAPAPGRRTRSESLPATGQVDPVQCSPIGDSVVHEDPFAMHLLGDAVQMHGGETDQAEHVHAAATHGIAGSGGALPFLDQIQASFGPEHDVTHVQAHVDDAAAEGSAAMGARAYATGNHVAFAGAPDLHTAAHEAAHVVQQRGGVQLARGVGKADDAYERHADAVADAVVRGDAAAPLLDGVGGRGALGVQGRFVQRHTESEHKAIGNAASGDRKIAFPGGLVLTFGDVVALAGDYYGGPAELWQMIETPGPKAGSISEVQYVLVQIERDKHGQRIRRAKEAKDVAAEEAARRDYIYTKAQEASFLPEVIAAVNERFLRLGRSNAPHFLDNDGDGKRDSSEVSMKEWQDYLTGALPPTAPKGYRLNHLQAISKAREAGQNSKSIDEALFFEAFGAHYLTDSFAAGHTRTPRRALTQHHDRLFPMFYTNLVGYMAEQIAEVLEKSMYGGVPSEDLINDGFGSQKGAYATIKETMDATGGMNFGDLVSGVLHDYDNHFGVRAEISGETVTLKGDGHLHEGDQFVAATNAAAAGVLDVESAYAMGKQGRSFGEIFEHLTMAHQGLFVAEAMLPEVLPDSMQGSEQHQLPTQAKSVDELLNNARFRVGLSLMLGEKAGMLEGTIASPQFTDEQRNAVRSRIIKRMRGGPDACASLLRDMLDWVPDTGGGFLGHDVRGDTMDYVNKVRNTPGGLETLTPKQRRKIFDKLYPASPGSDVDYALKLILAHAPPKEREDLDVEYVKNPKRNDPGADFDQR